jgi:hypothetical protein
MMMNSYSTLLRNNKIKYILEYLNINIDNKYIQHQKKRQITKQVPNINNNKKNDQLFNPT